MLRAARQKGMVAVMKKKTLKFWSVCLSACMALSMFVPMQAKAAALTDISSNWAKSYIEQGVKAGWISGYSDGTFRPNGLVTRGAFCKMLNKALGLQTASAISFSDVKTTDTFYTEIRKAVYAGYISGYTDGTFRANQSITHQQAAVMIARIITNPTAAKSLSAVQDADSIASYARSSVQKAYSKNYLVVTSAGLFNPTAAQTRAETARVIGSLVNGEKVGRAVSVTTSGKTLSNTVYTGAVTIAASASGTTTLSNCSFPGGLFIRSNGTVLLKNSSASSLVVNASGKTAVSVSGSSEIARTSLATGATLTESGLTGAGFNAVTLSGAALKTQATTLRGAFTTVTAATPAKLSLASGSIASLGVMQAAAGSAFALSAGTNVASATINGSAAFTGTGTITAAVQNAAGVTFQTKPASLTGSAVSTTDALTPAVTPANGSTGVTTTPTIRLTFPTALLNSAGTALTAANVASNVVELRKGSTTGTATVYSATVSTDRKTISVTPVSALASGATYYVIIRAGRLKTSAGAANSELTFSFTTAGTLIPTLTPASGSTNVPVGSSLTLTFSEAAYTTAGAKLSGAYLAANAAELHRDSVSGITVPYAATVSADNQTITLKPVSALEPGAAYYLVLKAGSLKNAVGGVNAAQTFHFTTAGVAPSVSISSGTTNVAVTSPSITLQFPEDAYLLGSAASIKVSQTATGTTVPCTVVFANGSRTAILSVSGTLLGSTQYSITIPDGTFTNVEGTPLNASGLSFTTAAAAPAGVSITSVDASSTSATVNFLSTVTGTATISMTNQVVRSAAVTANTAGSVKFDGLTPGSTYEITVVVRPTGQSTSVSAVKTITTRAPGVTLTSAAVSSNTATVHIACDYPGTVTLICSPTATLSMTQVSFANAGSADVSLTNLQTNTTYTVTAILNYNGGTTQGATTFATATAATGSALSSFRIQVPNNPVILYSNPAQTATCAPITVSRGSVISFTAVPASATASVTMNAYSFTASVGMTSYTAVVTVNNSGSVSTYTFVIPLTVT